MMIGLATPTIEPLSGLKVGGANTGSPTYGVGFWPAGVPCGAGIATGCGARGSRGGGGGASGSTGGGGAARGSTGGGGAARGSTGGGGAARGSNGAGGGG